MAPNCNRVESVSPSWNTREYWMNTSEIINQLPHLGALATKLYDENLEAGGTDYQEFTQGMKNLAYEHAEFLLSRFKANPDDPCIKILEENYPEINFQILENATMKERTRREIANEPISIFDYQPVPVAAGVGEINAFKMDEKIWKELPKRTEDTSKAMAEVSSAVGKSFGSFLSGDGLAFGAHTLVMVLGIGADFASDTFSSLKDIGLAISNRAITGEQGNAMLAAAGLLLLERLAAITTVNGFRDLRDNAYGKGVAKVLSGVALYTIAIQSFINTMGFVKRSKPMLWSQNWAEFNFVSPRFEELIAQGAVFFLAALLNYGPELYEFMHDMMKDNKKREAPVQETRTPRQHHTAQPAAAD